MLPGQSVANTAMQRVSDAAAKAVLPRLAEFAAAGTFTVQPPIQKLRPRAQAASLETDSRNQFLAHHVLRRTKIANCARLSPLFDVSL